MSGAPALIIEALTKTYAGPPEIRALQGVDLEVRPGEIFALLGPNGAGKTTTVGVCTTRVVPGSGRVMLDGLDVRASPALVKRRIGVVTQYNTLDRSCTVRENLYYHCRYFGMGGAEAGTRAETSWEWPGMIGAPAASGNGPARNPDEPPCPSVSRPDTESGPLPSLVTCAVTSCDRMASGVTPPSTRSSRTSGRR